MLFTCKNRSIFTLIKVELELCDYLLLTRRTEQDGNGKRVRVKDSCNELF